MIIEIYEGDRRRLLPLFALADDSPRQIALYLDMGEVLVAREGLVPIGHAQLVEHVRPGTFELKSLAVLETRQRQGIGGSLVRESIALCRLRGGSRLIVSTATASIGTLAFYQRRGFRMYRIVRDAFGPSSGYCPGILLDGIPLRDQVILDCAL